MPSHWYPDTCPSNPPCMVTDDATVRPCAAHALLGAAHDVARLKNLNQWKNRAYSVAVDDLALAEGITIPWSVDQNDLIHVVVGGNATRRSRIQAKIDAVIGAGKVVVE